MSFWTDITLREPLRQNRWYINFGNGLDSYKFALKECSKPEYSIETTSHVLLSHTFNYPKNLVWKPINIKMASVRLGDFTLSSELFRNSVNGGYTLPDFEQQEQLSKNRLISKPEILQIDSNGSVIEKWNLHNAFFSNINFGSLSYSNEDFVEISFTIIYDYASLSLPAASSTILRNEKIDEYDVKLGYITSTEIDPIKENLYTNKLVDIKGYNSTQGLMVGSPGLPEIPDDVNTSNN
jgi:hypothetical protein